MYSPLAVVTHFHINDALAVLSIFGHVNDALAVRTLPTGQPMLQVFGIEEVRRATARMPWGQLA
jgi:hypothetical protein